MRRFIFPTLPAALGLLVSALVTLFSNPEIVLVFRLGLGMVFFLVGLFTSLVWLGWELGRTQGQHDAFDQADQRRRSFIRRLDHELKNPLTGLRAALANLGEAATLGEREKASRNARRDVERLTRLLADLRKLSDLDQTVLERQPVVIPEVLDEMVEAAISRPDYHKRLIQQLIANVPPLPPITGDRDLLGLAFYNLVDNALKFTGSENTVQVRAREDGRSLVVEVADDGPGIAPEDQAHLFEELYRGANAHGVEGSGLGLALTARIVDLHGGSLKVASRPGGTVFSLSLPTSR